MSTQMKDPGPTTQQLLLENASLERKILQEILRTLLCFMGLTQIIKYIVFWTIISELGESKPVFFKAESESIDHESF